MFVFSKHFFCMPLAHSFIYFDQLSRYVQKKALERKGKSFNNCVPRLFPLTHVPRYNTCITKLTSVFITEYYIYLWSYFYDIVCFKRIRLDKYEKKTERDSSLLLWFLFTAYMYNSVYLNNSYCAIIPFQLTVMIIKHDQLSGFAKVWAII